GHETDVRPSDLRPDDVLDVLVRQARLGRDGSCAHDGGPCTEPGERLPRPQLGWVADPAHLADEPIDVRPSRQPGHRPLHVVRDLAADTPVRQLEGVRRSEEHTSELQSRENLVCRLLLEKKKTGPPAAISWA